MPLACLFPLLFKSTWSTVVTNQFYLLFYFRGEDSLKEYLEVKSVTIKMPYKIWTGCSCIVIGLLQQTAKGAEIYFNLSKGDLVHFSSLMMMLIVMSHYVSFLQVWNKYMHVTYHFLSGLTYFEFKWMWPYTLWNCVLILLHTEGFFTLAWCF